MTSGQKKDERFSILPKAIWACIRSRMRATPGGHDVSFYCDDIHGTVADLKSRGVTFSMPVADHGYGIVTYFEAPGGVKVQLYEPRYVKGSARAKAKRAPAKASRAKARRAAPRMGARRKSGNKRRAAKR